MGDIPARGIPDSDGAAPPAGANDQRAPDILPCESSASTLYTDLCPTIVCTGLRALPAGSTNRASWPPCLAASSTI